MEAQLPLELHQIFGDAVARTREGRTREAEGLFRQILAREPSSAACRHLLGNVLLEQGKADEAVVELAQARSLEPDHAPTHTLLAFAQLWQGRHVEAAGSFREATRLTQDHGRPVGETSVSRARMRHDAEQTRYLLERRLLGREHAPYAEALERLAQRASREAGPSWRLPVAADEMNAIAPSFNRLLHTADCPRLPGGALNPALDVPAIEARYHERRPELMYVDELLTRQALQSLRRFCLESTIWKRDYPGGYLGAFIGGGLASPLLLQIAEELRLRFPAIFKLHRLNQAWAFKYDSTSQGLKIHADTAAVNVNFWITPDAASLDSERGGLLVWDKEAPAEWDFSEYNNERKEPEVMELLERAGARVVTIPYRENRAVIFNSNLFHCTDSFNFNADYESRRVNVTLLYGRRETGHRRGAA